jgi:hypothetical protein
LAALAVALAAGLAACGDDDRQDVDEPEGEFPVEVTEARFPTKQRLAQTSDLRLGVENVGEETVPDLAVTIFTGDEKAGGPFDMPSEQPGLADPNRPVWILENEYPKLLEPGFEPAELAAGLHGKAKAVTADGSPVEGEFVVTITDKPPKTCVANSGEVLQQGECGI